MTRSISDAHAAIGIGGLCVLLAGAYFVLGLAPVQVAAHASQFKLPIISGGRSAIPADLDTATIKRAVRIAPLEQAVFNGAMMDAVTRNPNLDLAPWLKVLIQLGWRDVTSVQNVLADAAQRQDVQALVDPADALLRQNQLVPETTQLMNLAEAYAPTWPRVFAMLRSHVGWRYSYLEQAGNITNPEVLDGRARTIRALIASGDKLAAQEVRPFVAALLVVGRVGEADRLWRGYTGDRSNLIHDPAFREVVAIGNEPISNHALQWTVADGYGFSADVAPDGLSNALVSLRWDGRGVPVFLSQITSAMPGHQLLRVRVDGDMRAFADRIGFRLWCGDVSVAFEPVANLRGTDLVLKTSAPSTCAFPTLVVSGKVQTRARAFDGALSSITMTAAPIQPPTGDEPRPTDSRMPLVSAGRPS